MSHQSLTLTVSIPIQYYKSAKVSSLLVLKNHMEDGKFLPHGIVHCIRNYFLHVHVQGFIFRHHKHFFSTYRNDTCRLSSNCHICMHT